MTEQQQKTPTQSNPPEAFLTNNKAAPRQWSMRCVRVNEDSLEEEMATHSTVLAWTEELGGLCGPWRCKVSDTTERLTHTHIQMPKNKEVVSS